MSTNVDKIPIYIQFVETPNKSQKLVQEIFELAKRFNLYEVVTLADYVERGTDNGEDLIVYRIDIHPQTRADNGEDVMNFLDHVFNKMFDKFPSYVEPVKNDHLDTD